MLKLTIVVSLSAGFLGAASAKPYAYPPQHSFTQPFEYPDEAPPPPPPAGISFSGFHTSGMVLQRGATARAAVYGSVFGGGAVKVSLSVAEAGAAKYEVQAELQTGNATNWKAYLKPHAAYGGSASLTVSCVGCSGNTSATIADVAWGDVWCALLLPMLLTLMLTLMRR